MDAVMHNTPGFPGFDHVAGTEPERCFACRFPDPEPLPEGHPDREKWVARIRDWSLNDRGTPPVRDWQTPRQAPSHDGPFIRLSDPQKRGAV